MLPTDDTQERTLVQMTPPRFTSDGMPLSASSPLGSIGRYVLEAEIGRGGMGIVYRATDESIGRDVAIKVLHERSGSDPDAVRRFLVEARITGQLAHPGIPAVHEIGHLPDRRPFMVMKLIRGRTLDVILKERGAVPCGALLPVFEQICQAVGYAHSQGIIHRDLKPQNVMVGAFGEVQVMDWGLAKEVRGAEYIIGNAVHIPEAEQSETIAGSVMGTPAFMPPEQAGGANSIDERADVFGLGAILCVILTGKPPFIGQDTESARLLAAAAKLDDAYHRLETCGAEPELVELAKRCLAADRTARFPHAGEVAIAVAQLRVESDTRAREAELERARTETQAAGERSRRRTQFLLLATLLVLIGLTAVGTLWIRQQRAEREQLAGTQLLKDAAMKRQRDIRRKGLRFGITAELDQLNGFFARGMWKEAEENIRQCEEFLEADDDDASLQSQLDRAKLDSIFLKRFDAIRQNKLAMFGDKLATERASREYADAFREYGLDPDKPAAFVEMLKTAKVQTVLLSELDDWATTTPDANLQLRLMALTADATGQAWRREVFKNWNDAAAITALFQSIPVPQRSPEFVIAVGKQLQQLGGNGTAILELELRQHPADFWLHLALAEMYRTQRNYEAATGAYRAALAIRPVSVVWSNLAEVLKAKGDGIGATAAQEAAKPRD